MSLSSLEPTWLHQILFVHLVIAITYLTFTMHQGHYETLHRPCALHYSRIKWTSIAQFQRKKWQL